MDGRFNEGVTSTPTPEDRHDPAARGADLTVADFLRTLTPRAWVSPTIFALLVLAFAFETFRGVSPTSPTASSLVDVGASFGPLVVAGERWRILTCTFLHAGVLHLAFNLFVFWQAGRFAERVFGNVAFAALYLLSGVGGELASLAWNPMVVSVGASGAVFGVYGAVLAFVILHRGVLPEAFLHAQRRSLVSFLGYNVVFGLAVRSINLAAHLGGFLVGVVGGALLVRDLRSPREGFGRRMGFMVGLAVGLGVLSTAVVRRVAASSETVGLGAGTEDAR